MNKHFNPLEQYAYFVLNNPLSNLKPPANGIYTNKAGIDGVIFSVVIDRQGPYQTELFMVHPDIKEIRPHIHPGVDSFEFHLSGAFEFTVNKESYYNWSDGSRIFDRDTLTQVDANAPHGGNFTQGGSFLSFQYWHNGTPTSVGDSFVEVDSE